MSRRLAPLVLPLALACSARLAVVATALEPARASVRSCPSTSQWRAGAKGVAAGEAQLQDLHTLARFVASSPGGYLASTGAKVLDGEPCTPSSRPAAVDFGLVSPGTYDQTLELVNPDPSAACWMWSFGRVELAPRTPGPIGGTLEFWLQDVPAPLRVPVQGTGT